MNVLDEAKRMFDMAQKDFKALQAMTDNEPYNDDVFEFHARQAIIKALKSWLIIITGECPKTNDLGRLLSRLESQGVDYTQYFSLIHYNPFAVQLLRFDSFYVEEEPINRHEAIRQYSKLMGHINRLLK